MKPLRGQRLRAAIGGAGLAVVPMLLALAPVQEPATIGPGQIADTVAALKPGQYLWAPQVSPAGPMLMVVNLKTQRAALYRNGIPIGISTVSTGKPGHETPTGVYAVLQKKAAHRSSLYDDAPMPFMQRLTWDGIALHAGIVPGYPASHGCIRLPSSFARLLFAETQVGMLVVVTRLPTMPTMAMTGAAPLMPKSGQGLTVMWKVVKGTSPLTIVISAADREVRVIRDGREIGAAVVTINAAITAPVAYQLQKNGTWLQVPLPGQDGNNQQTLEPGAIQVDPKFRQRVLSTAAPGTTVVVTPDPLRPKLSTAIGLLHGYAEPE